MSPFSDSVPRPVAKFVERHAKSNDIETEIVMARLVFADNLKCMHTKRKGWHATIALCVECTI